MKLYATFLAGALAVLSYLPQASAEVVTFTDPYKMMEVLADKTFAQKISQTGKASLDASFSEQVVTDKYIEFYKKISSFKEE